MLPPELLRVIENRATAVPIGAGLRALRDEMQRRFGESLAAILFYGSCLRSGDVLDGLVDLYVVVDGYGSAYGRATLALVNWLLPPNVFYLEVPCAAGRVRAKYAVVSMPDLLAGTGPRWFHSYLWGRFAQPVAILYARDMEADGRVVEALGQAVVTLLSRALPRLPSSFTARGLWEGALALSYSAELRAEKTNRNIQLFDTYRDYYEDMTRTAVTALPYRISSETSHGVTSYCAEISARVRRRSRVAWAVRRFQGKVLSLLRLVKATFTFHGGFDYVIWKLERHSGVRIDVSERVRRHPLIYGWGLIWRLYRRGIFR